MSTSSRSHQATGHDSRNPEGVIDVRMCFLCENSMPERNTPVTNRSGLKCRKAIIMGLLQSNPRGKMRAETVKRPKLRGLDLPTTNRSG